MSDSDVVHEEVEPLSMGWSHEAFRSIAEIYKEKREVIEHIDVHSKFLVYYLDLHLNCYVKGSLFNPDVKIAYVEAVSEEFAKAVVESEIPHIHAFKAVPV